MPAAKNLVHEMREAAEYEGSSWTSKYDILKATGFKYAKCNDGRKCLMDRSNM
jgi:hypothetical protein